MCYFWARPVKSPRVSLTLSSLFPSCSPDLVLPLTPAPAPEILGPSTPDCIPTRQIRTTKTTLSEKKIYILLN